MSDILLDREIRIGNESFAVDHRVADEIEWLRASLDTALAHLNLVENVRAATIEECARWLEDMPEHWRTLASDMRAALREAGAMK